jgi:type III restriction enzyme
MSTVQQITAPQGDSRVPKVFQARIIDNLCAKLQSAARPPCLLRSPTGSGKTFMLTRALQRVSSQQPTLWLWFVPYVNLIAQTVDSIDSEGLGLLAVQLPTALNEEPAQSLVLISTLQGVASLKARKTGYTSAEDDDRRSIAAYVARARAQGLAIGCVVDEAHIALHDDTEFGQFVHWLKADYLLMASATPRDERLARFIQTAGYGHFETFSVSRTDVVKERLNKAWIQSVVYPLRQSMQSVTDLKMTVLRRAWRRNQQIEKQLRALGLTTVPLLLVQVGNGDEAIAEAQDFLTRELAIPAHAIGVHSAKEADPVMMAAIANDTSKQVLVFKQAAGTGFDAPRAFVLASTKPVNDPDFATQFIGRVMRVAPEMQRAFPDAATVPIDLDTAYVFLANIEAQAGFKQAADAIGAVKSDLEGQTEQLVVRRTAYGGVALTNRPTDQTPLTYDLALLPTRAVDGSTLAAAGTVTLKPVASAADMPPAMPPIGVTGGLFEQLAEDDLDELLDDAVADTAASPGHSKPVVQRVQPKAPTSQAEVMQALQQAGIRAVARRSDLRIPTRFTTEVQPVFEAMALDVRAAAQNLDIDTALQANAIKAALNRMSEKEIYTELFTGQTHEEDVQVITDSQALMELTFEALHAMGLEDDDCKSVIETLASRMMQGVELAWALQDDAARPAAADLRSKSRQAACWVLHKRLTDLQDILYSQWANKAIEAPSALLPDALLIPDSVSVQASRKNTYGVLFPDRGAVTTARDALAPHARAWYKSEDYILPSEIYSVAAIDATYELNPDELLFAKALDHAEFVHWWHRNPDRKPFSVALLRADGKNMFYPDFLVCMEHVTGESPLMRLVDTKHDIKDAVNKSGHISKFYGKVLFLTEVTGSKNVGEKQFRIIHEDGTQGDKVDFDDLGGLKIWMHASMPSAQDC